MLAEMFENFVDRLFGPKGKHIAMHDVRHGSGKIDGWSEQSGWHIGMSLNVRGWRILAGRRGEMNPALLSQFYEIVGLVLSEPPWL
jgi:hypothetical protein